VRFNGRMGEQRHRWVTAAGVGLAVFAIGFALIAPADWLGFPLLAGAALLVVGIGARV